MLFPIQRAFIPVILLSSQVLQIEAVPHDGEDNSLLPAFTLVGQGNRDQGNCAGDDLELLKSAYEDACAMSRRAVEDLDFLVDQAKATAGKGPDKKSNKADYSNYRRILDTFIALFGTSPFDQQGNVDVGGPLFVPNDGSYHLKGFFETMVNEKCSGRDIDKRIFCTDNHWEFLKNDAQDPTDPSKTIQENLPQCQTYGGIWYSSVQPAGEQWLFAPPPSSPGKRPICDDRKLAVTHFSPGTITFCQLSLNPNVVLDTIKGFEGSIKPTNTRYGMTDKALDKMRLGDLIKKKDLTSIEFLRDSLSLTFLHEMLHLLTDKPDQDAVDEDGNPIMDRDGKPELTYGWTRCRNLATHDTQLSWGNPDNVALFALAMYFRQWDWSRGYPQPVKKAD
ncbi:hypothetical protein DM02DRAFT_664156 [Periconia macrospinosa]|uniref:Lysine-specific metallo-endopeptidase domain-containing protein n=1 Tax=Periconia macrospinosa TaxID=97972 RepID=A0A2V1CZV9_9PLEO|nr:hypothetical protein DM02DRAFT_664156 [Periconia macrospinosa]